MKKLLAILLSLVVAISSVSVVFADPPELDTPVTEEDIEGMWASGTYTVPANSTINTASFNIPERYFAFEMTATLSSGGTAPNASYTVILKKGSGTIASGSGYINGGTYKFDWITITDRINNHYFTITNNYSSAISVTLTYYSWA